MSINVVVNMKLMRGKRMYRTGAGKTKTSRRDDDVKIVVMTYVRVGGKRLK